MDILQQIIEMDKAAAARTKKLCEEELKKLDAIDAKNSRRMEKALANERAQAEQYYRSRQMKLEKKKADSATELSESINKLDEIFSAHRSEWQDEIISRITGV